MGNRTVLNKAFLDFENQIRAKVRERLSQWCAELVKKAVDFRLGDYQAHNFTGNLLNSIVVVLYENRKPVRAYYSSEDGRVKSAIMRKMTARKKPYVFSKLDYEGRLSTYAATIETNRGFGVNDARNFFNEFRPSGKNSFDVVVAYTVEYADFVEFQRGTTGFLIEKSWAKQSGMTFMELVSEK